MPDNNDKPAAQAQPVAVAAPAQEAEVAKQPMTPVERQAAKHKMVEGETDDQRSQRRAAELNTHLQAHMETMTGIHAAYPAAFHTKAYLETLALMSSEAAKKDIEAWNARRYQIDTANMAYHRAVKQTFADHQAEEAHLARVRKAKAAA